MCVGCGLVCDVVSVCCYDIVLCLFVAVFLACARVCVVLKCVCVCLFEGVYVCCL